MPSAIPSFLADALRRPVAVLGGGVSGTGAVALVRALGGQAEIYDVKGAALTAEAAARHGLVVFSPGFAPAHPWLALARAAGAICLGELDFASLFWRGEIIAITGTNGKTTLTEFLAQALRDTGTEAQATGNIGYPFTQLVVDTDGGSETAVAVCEVSSFQAESMQHFRAAAVLWTNFAEDHLERHGSLEGYFAAKAVLLQRLREGGRGFVGESVARYAANTRRRLPVGTQVVVSEHCVFDPELGDTIFSDYPQRENFELARAWWRAEGRPEEALRRTARAFRLGRHRLARVAEVDGVTYWNDSKATNFHAVEAALHHFAAPVRLIAGGRGKGGDIAAFVARAAPQVEQWFLIGETRTELAAAVSALGRPPTVCESLADAVRQAAAGARPGTQILLSPGFASFDMFRSYEDRGDQFERVVQELRAAPSF
ncbi:UDP-N-acetylmuramoyl-L-alanine--D-glutamate ligase [Horticoccus luteus]|uniref:UDP-N-acetylmuramoylalanine--D-glutamate ligase n=1 Tax=Horticoccus luteus TaxID=2862869 RepID=A0A8F9XKH9_9BACT|nr:UDP-N-acetylmuramoyl-L-alanine--D-glutamate ligase [Horticoccus luteus]QYM78084.1 UDP-N-acetylmuramoyl-L-alanine--D-glutamate ligase [Horticoccus luteus]